MTLDEQPAASMCDLIAALDASTTCPEFARAGLLAQGLIPCTVLTMDVVNINGASILCASTTAEFEEPGLVDQRLRWAQQSPVVAHRPGTSTTPPVAISSLLERDVYLNSSLYTDFHRHLGIEDELVVEFDGSCGLSHLRFSRSKWGFTDDELATAEDVQDALRIMARVRRERDTATVGAQTARSLAEKSGTSVWVGNPDGSASGLDGSPADLPHELDSTIRAALAVAAATPRNDGGPLVEMLVPSTQGRQLTVRVLPSPTGSLHLPVIIATPRGTETKDLRQAGLTTRQAEVMALIIEGHTNASAALKLGISERTVEKHVVGAYAKLDVHSRTQALRKLIG